MMSLTPIHCEHFEHFTWMVERPERTIVGGHGARSESDRCPEELAAWVEHVYSMSWSARSRSVCGIVSPSALAVLRPQCRIAGRESSRPA
jgi:hypothetical protein